MLSFAEAEEFCHRVTRLLRSARLIDAEEEIRLPSETEWEYVARAGGNTQYGHGDDVAELPKYAWYSANAAGNDPAVGALRPNPWGLYDVHGYLWEWCQDAWQNDYSGAPTDGSSRAADGAERRRVLRGGSWKDDAAKLTCTFRRAAEPTLRDDAVGLRCVLARTAPAR